jgi:hypothetical protein
MNLPDKTLITSSPFATRVREVCPVFPGDPQQIHWSFPDPAAVTGSEDEQFQAFYKRRENYPPGSTICA